MAGPTTLIDKVWAEHVVQRGMAVSCGDSPPSTHGALGALAFGVGTSDGEHVLATQTLALERPASMLVEFRGTVPADVTPKDLALAFISQIGANGAYGHVLEYSGGPTHGPSMEGRMTRCNTSNQARARGRAIPPDDTPLPHPPD